MRGSGLGAVVLLAAWLCATPGAAQASFIFKKVAATGDAAPDGGAYLEFRGAPSLDRGQVAFRAVAVDGPSGRLGVFLSNKAGEGVGTVVDTLTAIPGGAGPFTGFGTLSLDGGQVAVIGFGADPDPEKAIYLSGGSGGLAEIARVGSVISQEEPFFSVNDLFDVSLSQGRAAFFADIQFEDILTFAVMRSDGAVFDWLTNGFQVDPTTCCVSLDGDQAVFAPAGPLGGVFSAAAGAVSAIADPDTPVDGTLFLALDRPAVHKGQTVFVAAGLGRQGVFLHTGSGFTPIADTGTPVPDGGGALFLSFDQPSVNGGAAAFLGCGVAGCGVYTTLGGALAKVIAQGDLLGGKTVAEVEVGREAISCSSIAFRAAFTDGSQAVYRADLEGGAACPAGLDTLTDLTVWAGLRNSDDQGTAFDVRAEVSVAGTLVASGEAHCVVGLTRNPARARPILVKFSDFSPPDTQDGDDLSLTVLARIGTGPEGERCSGPGATHASAAGLRVYFDSVSLPSAFGIGMGGGAPLPVYLRGGGPRCLGRPSPAGSLSLAEAAGTGVLAKCADSHGVAFQGGDNPWKEVGTWTTRLSGDGVTATAATGWRGRWRRP
jgi:hypothetical protein